MATQVFCNASHHFMFITITESLQNGSNYMYLGFVPNEDSDQPGHLPSLNRMFTVHFMGS